MKYKTLGEIIGLGQSQLRRLGELLEPELYVDYYDIDDIANDFTQMPYILGSISCKKRDNGEPIINDLSRIRHLLRYKFLSLLAYDKIVLDCACGCGYGSYILSRIAREVLGIDLDSDAINFANKYHKMENISFVISDIEKFGKYDFDLIVSVETFEHIAPKKIDSFLSSLKSMVVNNGIIAITTPLVGQTIQYPVGSNFVGLHSHYVEYSKKDFINILIENGLKVEQYVLQKFDGSIVYNIPKNLRFPKDSNQVQIAICKVGEHHGKN